MSNQMKTNNEEKAVSGLVNCKALYYRPRTKVHCSKFDLHPQGYPKLEKVKRQRREEPKKQKPLPFADRHEQFCTYCGDFFQCRDHVIPVAYSDIKRSKSDTKNTVDCCHECNQIAYDYLAFSVREKATFLLTCYQSKYRDLLTTPYWDDEELEELSWSLQQHIKANENLRRLVEAKLDNLKLTSLGASAICIWPNLHFFWAK